MEKEFIELAKKLKDLAIKYNEEYLHLCYINGAVMGNTATDKEVCLKIYIPKEDEE